MEKLKNKDFCIVLSTLRHNKNLKMKDVADSIGLNPTTYRKYENGSLEPSFVTLVKLADFYNVTTDYLLGRDQQESNEDSKSTQIDSHIKVIEEQLNMIKDIMGN